MTSNQKKSEGLLLLSAEATFDPLDFKDQTKIKQKEHFQKQIRTYITLLAIILFQVLGLLFLSYKKTQAQTKYEDIQTQITIFDKQIKDNTEALNKLNTDYDHLNSQYNSIQTQHQEQVVNLNKLKEEYQTLINQYKEKRLKNIQDTNKAKLIILSTILENEEDLKLIESWIGEGGEYDYANWDLIYKATIDGDIPTKFHQRVDNNKPTMILIETKKGSRFGGYTTKSWGSPISSESRVDNDAFLFSLNTKMKYAISNPSYAIFASSDSCPAFGLGDLTIVSQFLKRGSLSQSNFPQSYGLNNDEGDEKLKEKMKLALTDGEANFQIDELEVFQLK